ncbi:hypothetical protein [Vulcanisaeta thermophila]|uniref:hypothetical protein n=1 Tax=Vulcanisaeta thermophila TaxID=867917 RepID=UPI000853D363|nr:hypothetical protein [Vulcanisaeta thermophila]
MSNLLLKILEPIRSKVEVKEILNYYVLPSDHPCPCNIEDDTINRMALNIQDNKQVHSLVLVKAPITLVKVLNENIKPYVKGIVIGPPCLYEALKSIDPNTKVRVDIYEFHGQEDLPIIRALMYEACIEEGHDIRNQRLDFIKNRIAAILRISSCEDAMDILRMGPRANVVINELTSLLALKKETIERYVKTVIDVYNDELIKYIPKDCANDFDKHYQSQRLIIDEKSTEVDNAAAISIQKVSIRRLITAKKIVEYLSIDNKDEGVKNLISKLSYSELERINARISDDNVRRVVEEFAKNPTDEALSRLRDIIEQGSSSTVPIGAKPLGTFKIECYNADDCEVIRRFVECYRATSATAIQCMESAVKSDDFYSDAFLTEFMERLRKLPRDRLDLALNSSIKLVSIIDMLDDTRYAQYMLNTLRLLANVNDAEGLGDLIRVINSMVPLLIDKDIKELIIRLVSEYAERDDLPSGVKEWLGELIKFLDLNPP